MTLNRCNVSKQTCVKMGGSRRDATLDAWRRKRVAICASTRVRARSGHRDATAGVHRRDGLRCAKILKLTNRERMETS